MAWNALSKTVLSPRPASCEPTALAAGSSSLQPPFSSRQPANEFWALKDISFEVKQGEVVGIIGRNGAGKSTLLKILSRITEPTSGRFGIRGRVASLLEVGTGFHPELTGRENIFVSGITLGMTRAEIKKRFDEIVGFSGVEKFLDTPVKHYSSGMQVRLGFAVAAHLESEILIVDEVLAVGDAEFQKKCLGRMAQVASSGKTTIFVSHSMDAIRGLCERVVVLFDGRISHDGESAEGIRSYYNGLLSDDVAAESIRARRKRTSGKCHFTQLSLASTGQVVCEGPFTMQASSDLKIEMQFQVDVALGCVGVFVAIKSDRITSYIVTARSPLFDEPLQAGEKRSITVTIPKLRVAPGDYHLYLWLGDTSFVENYDVLDHQTSLKTIFHVVANDRLQQVQGLYHEDIQIKAGGTTRSLCQH